MAVELHLRAETNDDQLQRCRASWGVSSKTYDVRREVGSRIQARVFPAGHSPDASRIRRRSLTVAAVPSSDPDKHRPDPSPPPRVCSSRPLVPRSRTPDEERHPSTLRRTVQPCSVRVRAPARARDNLKFARAARSRVYMLADVGQIGDARDPTRYARWIRRTLAPGGRHRGPHGKTRQGGAVGAQRCRVRRPARFLQATDLVVLTDEYSAGVELKPVARASPSIAPEQLIRICTFDPELRNRAVRSSCSTNRMHCIGRRALPRRCVPILVTWVRYLHTHFTHGMFFGTSPPLLVSRSFTGCIWESVCYGSSGNFTVGNKARLRGGAAEAVGSERKGGIPLRGGHNRMRKLEEGFPTLGNSLHGAKNFSGHGQLLRTEACASDQSGPSIRGPMERRMQLWDLLPHK
ncbi:hypothetical protein K488DRAFT_74950 [Vararia minispora EC-137]|uniref:Uncharacterized protein n=1 Tax=Vararia minispora EC-137 TaxID=1314806 RepID=A0ACB8Q5B7_9AGAM|nr:hypothetical protein K488DRAFT_74950 [Vararia minispora EC-137]